MLGGNDLAAKELASEIATELVPVGAEVDGTSGAETIDVTFPARVNEQLSPKTHTDRGLYGDGNAGSGNQARRSTNRER